MTTFDLFFILVVVCVIAWCIHRSWGYAIVEFIDIIESKVGTLTDEDRRRLRRIGWWASPIALGLLACATPDVSGQEIINPNKPANPPANQLPEV